MGAKAAPPPPAQLPNGIGHDGYVVKWRESKVNKAGNL